MLELRPGCEHCDKPLAPDATDARICSYECTFCAACVDHVLLNVCPNCGGGFEKRPVRPATNRKNGNYLGTNPAAIARKHRPVDLDTHAAFASALAALAPEQR